MSCRLHASFGLGCHFLSVSELREDVKMGPNIPCVCVVETQSYTSAELSSVTVTVNAEQQITRQIGPFEQIINGLLASCCSDSIADTKGRIEKLFDKPNKRPDKQRALCRGGISPN